MKIAIYVRCLGRGGAEKTAANLSIELAKEHDVDVIVHEPFVEYEYSGNLISMDIDYENSSGILKFFKVSKKLKKNIKKLKKEKKYDYVISFMESSNLSNVQTKIKRTKNIISVRNHRTTIDQMRGFKGKVIKYLTKKHYNKADLIIACSKDIKQDLIINYKLQEEKIKVIYNPLDINLIKSFDKVPNNLDKSKFNIVNVGRLGPQKGQWHLIRAMVDVVLENKDAILHILGRGEYEDKLIKLTKELSLENNIIFHGFSKEVYNFLNNCDLSVLSSLFEGIPNAITEAFAASLPVIATNCMTGPRELLAEKSIRYNDTICDIIYGDGGIIIPAFSSNIDFYDISKEDKEIEKFLSKAIIEMFDEKTRAKFSLKSKEKSNNLRKDKIIMQWNELLK